MKEDQIDERAEKSTAESPCHRPRLSRVNIAANHRTSNTPLYIHLFVHTNPSHPQKIPTFRIVCTSNLLSQPPERKLETIPLILGEAHQLFLLLPIPPTRARILGKVDRVLRPIRLRPGKTGPVVIILTSCTWRARCLSTSWAQVFRFCKSKRTSSLRGAPIKQVNKRE